jgi:hypothetical protein
MLTLPRRLLSAKVRGCRVKSSQYRGVVRRKALAHLQANQHGADLHHRQLCSAHVEGSIPEILRERSIIPSRDRE